MIQTNQKSAAQKFTSYVVSHLIKEFYPEEENYLFGNSNATKIFKDLLLDAYSEKIAEKTDFGIRKKIEKSVIQLQDIRQVQKEVKNGYSTL